jgi:hypothetical protein
VFTTCAQVTICLSATTNPMPAGAADPLRKIRTVKPSRLAGGTSYFAFRDMLGGSAGLGLMVSPKPS